MRVSILGADATAGELLQAGTGGKVVDIWIERCRNVKPSPRRGGDCGRRVVSDWRTDAGALGASFTACCPTTVLTPPSGSAFTGPRRPPRHRPNQHHYSLSALLSAEQTTPRRTSTGHCQAYRNSSRNALFDASTGRACTWHDHRTKPDTPA
ncbi:hypothetical protein K491DRAFT_508947 [Lophiostoma macrostomum CBS 122681]|uniref:Uncharacterized protein n=1 Tax=Lophiostoma macrostomum CBS 122681 TaxID=1314788 RepID=A0A6A6T1G7_9PLEO|nr:hypothetical protein K491DRAFT_508947 [Lophiostoma macrostomum CBS 122681]